MSIVDLGNVLNNGDGDIFTKFKNAASSGSSIIASNGTEILSEAGRQTSIEYEKFKKTPLGYTGDLINDLVNYQDESNNIQIPRGTSEKGQTLYNNSTGRGKFNGSLSNKIHLIRISKNLPENDLNQKSYIDNLATNFYDLCAQSKGVVQYDVDDFLYVKELGLPINRMITLRRFPYAVTDNIFDKFNQSHPDISRLVSFFHEDGNRLEDILALSFGLRWKELVAEYEQSSMNGDQSGLSGYVKKIMKFIDPIMSQDKLRGEVSRNYDPKFDQNKVYGPVDSINATNIRDVGFDYDKHLEISFKYELRSMSGRTPEYAMRDVLANVLATTFNNGKFWGGARFWIGERPTQYLNKFQGILNPTTVSEWAERAREGFTSIVGQFGSTPGSKIQALKNMMGNVLSNAMAVGLGMILDKVGRASIITTNSLLSGEPVGNWHLTVGHPQDPILCVGNLICIGVDMKFPTEELSYGNFPTQMEFIVKLKSGMPKDKAQIEMMFNMGMQRIYHNPKKVKISKNVGLSPSQRRYRTYDGSSENSVENEKILHTFNETFDFSPTKDSGDGKTAIAQNTEILIDGQEYVSNVDYDKALLAEKPELDPTDRDFLTNMQNQAASQQNSGNYGTMTNGSGTVIAGNTPSNIPTNQKTDYLMSNLQNQGYSKEQAAGIIGGLTGESGSDLNENAVNPSSKAYGIAQWLGKRKEQLASYCSRRGVPINNAQAQMDFIMWELQNTEKGAANRIKSASNAQEAAYLFTKYYERPSQQEINHSLAKRQNNALGILRRYI